MTELMASDASVLTVAPLRNSEGCTAERAITDDQVLARSSEAAAAPVGAGYKQKYDFGPLHRELAIDLGPVQIKGFTFKGEFEVVAGGNIGADIELRAGTTSGAGGFGSFFSLEGIIDKFATSLGEITPKIKGEVKATTKKWELTIEVKYDAKLGGEEFSTGVELTVIKGDWEKREVEFLRAEIPIDVTVHRIALRDLLGKTREEMPQDIILAEVKLKGSFELGANWKWTGYQELAKPLLEAGKKGITFFITEEGALTFAGAASLAAGVAVAVLAWEGYVLFKVQESRDRGRAIDALVPYYEGYADELARLSSPSNKDVQSAIDEGNAATSYFQLASRTTDTGPAKKAPWQDNLNAEVASFVESRNISLLFAAITTIGNAGRAAAYAQFTEFMDNQQDCWSAWADVASQLRATYGADAKTRRQKIRQTVRREAYDGKAVAIPLSGP